MVNPYDRCKSKITIDDKKCMIGYYVDGNKVSRIKNYVDTRIIDTIAGYFGEIAIWREKNTSL